MSADVRPSPEQFLNLIRRQERGRLKVYLGSSAGVGKTFAMLREGQRLKKQGVDVAIEFSGRYAALHHAMRSARLAGRVVAAGFYVGDGSELRLGEEFHHNRLTLVGSMSGWGAPSREAGWNRRRLRQTALDLLMRESLDVAALITHRFPFHRAAEAYELVDTRPEETLRVVLTY